MNVSRYFLIFVALSATAQDAPIGVAYRAFHQDVLAYEARMMECKRARPHDAEFFEGRLAQFRQLVAEAMAVAEQRLINLHISERTWASYEAAGKAQVASMAEIRKGMGESLFMFTCIYFEEKNPLPTPQVLADAKVKQFAQNETYLQNTSEPKVQQPAEAPQ